MAGVHPITYWTSNLIWDMAIFMIVRYKSFSHQASRRAETISTYLLSILCTLIIVFTDQRDLFSSNGAGFAYFLLMFLYGTSGILMAYSFSFITKSAPSAFSLFIVVVLIAGKQQEHNVVAQ